MTRLALALLLALAVPLGALSPVAAFDRFASVEAESSFGAGVTFRAEIVGTAPDRLELLLRFGDDEATFVAPVGAASGGVEWTWDTASNHLTPNTRIAYRWRAESAGRVSVSPEREIVYRDDRPGLDWQTEHFGEANVHWYGDAVGQARRFGELTAGAARRAEELLGHELAGPIDIFVYDTRDDFFAVLGPGAREWIGAAAFPQLRSVFMQLRGNTISYLEVALVHEVTHVVFHDATDNPFGSPAKWLNEGIAVWSETQGADRSRSLVEFEARGGQLLAFEAIADQFPVDERSAGLAYAQGATMVDRIIRDHGPQAIATIAAAYREGATDAEALEAGTGVPADELFAAFFADFGVEEPQPVEPDPLLPSNVDLPPGADEERPGGGAATPDPADGAPRPGVDPPDGSLSAGWPAVAAVVVLIVGLLTTAFALRRRSSPEGGE
jgi:hypothetical protein